MNKKNLKIFLLPIVFFTFALPALAQEPYYDPATGVCISNCPDVQPSAAANTSTDQPYYDPATGMCLSNCPEIPSNTSSQTTQPQQRQTSASSYTAAQTSSNCPSGELCYTPLEPLPGLSDTGTPPSLQQIFNFAFRTLFALGGFIAVFSLMYGGIAYMTSEIANQKIKAKERIWSSLYGLGLLAVSYLILYTINPNLLKFNFTGLDPQGTSQNTNASLNNGGQVLQVRVGIDRNHPIIEIGDADPDKAAKLSQFDSQRCQNRGVKSIRSGSGPRGTFSAYECK